MFVLFIIVYYLSPVSYVFLIVSLSLQHSSVSPGFDAVDLPGSRLGARGSDGFIAAGSRAVQIPTASGGNSVATAWQPLTEQVYHLVYHLVYPL